MGTRSRRCARTGELPHRARPRVASAGGAGIGSPSVEMDRVEGPSQGEAAFAAVRQGRGGDEPWCLRKARGSLWQARVALLQGRHDRLLSGRGQKPWSRPGLLHKALGKGYGVSIKRGDPVGEFPSNTNRPGPGRDGPGRGGRFAARPHLLQRLHQFCNRRGIIMFSCRPILIP